MHRAELYFAPMGNDDAAERERTKRGADLCRAEGGVCKFCGAIPERGQQFTENLCDDCRKMARNE